MDPLKEGETLDKIFNPRGYPTLLKGAFVKDQDEVVAFLSEKNKGKQMRMLNFEKYTDPHFSISASRAWTSPYYAGFEAITDTEDVEKVLGIKSDQMGGRDYKMNNLFVELPERHGVGRLHCAPIDSLSIQLVGTKTWYFVGPDDLKDIPSTPLPTRCSGGIKHGFKFGKNPQDNRVIFGDIYEYLNHYFTECGPSKSAEALFATAKLAP
ncbi:hypothetical protein JL722_14514 [Aureococcus anophagefferens]|nr:hypothetical protein JL722_14514 [Aureococcus anophagefferens]